jgi:hypothetical protein
MGKPDAGFRRARFLAKSRRPPGFPPEKQSQTHPDKCGRPGGAARRVERPQRVATQSLRRVGGRVGRSPLTRSIKLKPNSVIFGTSQIGKRPRRLLRHREHVARGQNPI